jgi:hypothetical protein
MPHYAVVTADGVPLDDMRLNGYDWQPGSTIFTGPTEPNLRVVEVLESDDADKAAILVVEEAA